MAPSPVLIDTAADFGPAPVTTSRPPHRNLVLAPPSFAGRQDAVRNVLETLDHSLTDFQMLDRLSAGLVRLAPSTYDNVLVLSDARNPAPVSDEPQLLSRSVLSLIVPAMVSGAQLTCRNGDFTANDSKEAILAGLVAKGNSFEKQAEADEVAIPLRLGKKNKTVAPAAPAPDLDPLHGGDDDDDDLIDEDDLLTEEDLKRRPVQHCQPQKRRRPCKDCTCGLAAQFEAQDLARRTKADKTLNALKLDADDLNELDFTVKGKTGSCNNCSLGDAFRCSTCPYIGLPAFKPGEQVRLLNDLVQL
ncbi:hypothetical protein CDD82_5521 [Ophiocordyceps australis]|uniref:Uncharacterized protein n=1 Tax=Ophiocordyceps australis TaxID=1399860 RepID=A0A2C5Z0G8_9HYPO|nr:hypothetical protein CDD82_5521 [Ophiocordyceps australis]